MQKIKASIIICTCNRAESLAETLRSLAALEMAPGLEAELIVVDNGSEDDTAKIALNYPDTNMRVKLVHEGKKGLSRARNTGIAESCGDILVFTDDDLRHPAEWLVEMIRPIWQGEAHAVVGGVRCAPHLMRPWMNTVHRAWLACTDHLDPKSPKELVGANMVFSRDVLRRVPRFDTELGAGASGYGEDSLFSAQLLQAGYRIASAFHVVSEHHFQEERLHRASFLNAALKMARSTAYKDYHWEHRNVAALPLRLFRSRLRLDHWRKRHPSEVGRKEGIQGAELQYLFAVKYFEAYLKLAGTPRLYDRHGLEKRVDNATPQKPMARAA